MSYLVTGGTGFIGRLLLQGRGRPVHVLVREASKSRLEQLEIPNMTPVVGDVTRAGLGLSPSQALLSRPPEVSTRLGKLGEAVDTLSPGLLRLVMTGAYHAFPETAPGRDGEKEGRDEEISSEAAAMAYLMRGIHL